MSLCACGTVKGDSADAKQADACIAETDTELCTAANACESRPLMDRCGVERTVDCGACTGGKGCVVGVCQTPVCSSFTYTQAAFPTMSTANVEDSIGGATPDGRVILYVKTVSGVCQNYHLVVADEVTAGSGTYTQRDVGTAFTALGLANAQDSYAITPDGLTILTVTADRKKLTKTTRSAINMIDFGTPSETDFPMINPQTMGNSKIIISPTLSADGLELWYSLYDTTAGTYEVFSAVRASASQPFPAPTPAVAPVSNYPLVSGISSDRLALFLFDNYSGRVLTRTSTSKPFTNPNAPAAPPQIPAWGHKPLASCAKIVAMTSPGGCQNEDVVVLTRQ